MQVALRETGSIVVNAPRERVFEVLQRDMASMAAAVRATPAERLESGPSTFVLRDAPGGTRVIHARSRPGYLLSPSEPRHELRAAVEAELLRVQRLVQDAP
jgi:hypothetical protein